MLKSYKLYAENGKLFLVVLEYGNGNVTVESITEAIGNLGLDFHNENPVQEAIKNDKYAVVEVASPPPANLHGVFWLELDVADGTVTAHLYPPIGTGRPATETEIVEELKQTEFNKCYIDRDAARENVEKCNKKKEPASFLLAERRDAVLAVELSEDRRTALLDYTPPMGGSKPDFNEALKLLEKNGVVYGVDEARLKEILDAGRIISKQQIAHAKAAVHGVDASIEFLFDAHGENQGPRIRENDTADFRDLGLRENVEEGAQLVKKNPATQGEDGTDVTGKPLPAEPGKDMELPRGKNTGIRDDDENMLVAEVCGIPVVMGGKVCVDEILVVDDVDFSTGNIDFHGSVMVKGIVNSGFSIVARGDITCSDTVEGADLKAGGSILLKFGIKGMGKSTLDAGVNVIGRFIERCTVRAGNSVVVDEALIHSDTAAVDIVEATNSKGSIFGGHVRAGNLVKAAFIGSEMAVQTHIEVGVAPHIREELVHCNEDIKKKKSDYDKASKNYIALKTLRDKNGLPVDREQLYNTLATATGQLKNDIEEITSRIASLEDDLTHCAEGRVEATNVIYPGVKVTIKNANRKIREAIHKAILVKDGPDVVLSTEIAEQNSEE